MIKILERVKKKFKKRDGKEISRIALFVDGPNMLRGEFDYDLSDIKLKLEEIGMLKIGKVYLDQYAPEKLIEAVANQGFEPTMITTADVDAPMAADIMEAVYNENIDKIAIMTRDSDFQRVLIKAKERGKDTIVIGAKSMAVALENTADHAIII